MTTMNIVEPETGPGYWKMKNSITKTDLFKNTFETFWKSWKLNINKFKDKKEFWDLTKTKIKDITITISKKLRLNENEVKNWEDKLENLLENDGTQQNLNEDKIRVFTSADPYEFSLSPGQSRYQSTQQSRNTPASSIISGKIPVN
ncbi:Hypothetical predicted protein [Mytilus galloprovincialis]|uniref:Uncharacterized protein n=1 Tax=Mytilus galloprovincialis TaxID=29158 RepID=A0A8B6FAY1_MYTGA|nr:Hypothetical predicted protein [Mytilus galloprovincialis]